MPHSFLYRCSLGKGLTGIGSSGGGHGGNGGSGSNQPRVGIAYGHLYEPAHFGCPGGGGGGGLGGGVHKHYRTGYPKDRRYLKR